MQLKYKFTILSLFLITSLTTNLVAQPFGLDWLQQIGNEDREIINDMVVDRVGNVYCIGSFYGDFKVNGIVLMSAKGEKDAFISKTSKDGKLLWAKQISSKGDDFASRMSIAPNGFLYIIGGIDVESSAGKQKIENKTHALYVSQFSASGDVKWIQYFESNEYNRLTGLTSDAQNNVYVMGTYNDSLTLGKKKWFSKPDGSLFVAKFDNKGRFENFKQLEGSGEKYPSVIQSFESGVWIGGRYTNQLTAETMVLETENQNRKGIFAIMLDHKMNVEGAWTIAEANDITLTALQVDSAGVAYLAGDFTDSINIQGQILKAKGVQDIFVCTIDTLGKPLWAKRIGGLRTNTMIDMKLNHKNELITAFAASGSVLYDSLHVINHKLYNDIQLTAINPSGSFLWSLAYGGNSEDFPCRVAIDKDDQIIFSATFKDSMKVESKQIIAKGDQDFFIAKLIDCKSQKIKIIGDTLLCMGSEGRLQLKKQTYKNFNWQFGQSTEKTFNVQKAGAYHLTVTDPYACILSDSIKVRNLPLPFFSLGKDTMINNFLNLKLEVKDTLKSYEWLNGSNTKSFNFDGSTASIGKNSVWLRGTDKNECSFTDTILVDVKALTFSKSEQLDSASISIYPNPAHDVVNYTINHSFQNITVRVVDNFGHVFLEKRIANYIENLPEQMNISKLNQGMYYIKVYSNSVVKSIVFYVE